MNQKEKKWFSLIEVVIATAIISITVFWIYKLISENTKIINNSWNYFLINSLFPSLEECIDNIPPSSFVSGIYYFSFWNNLKSCSVQTTETWTIIDNIIYKMRGEIITNWLSDIEWNLYIWSENTKDIMKNYRQIK